MLDFDTAIIAQIPVLIKARDTSNSMRRLVEFEASCEAPDWDGDIILQKALVGSADSYVATGHLDIDHYSEFGARLGIPNPASYVVGRPLEVKALANGSTYLLGEISRSPDGTVDVVNRKYDELWESLRRDPPVIWYASIYGFPLDIDDCTQGACSHPGATRWVVKALDWRSTAFTRKPKNEALKGHAKIVTAKSHFMELAKSMSVPVADPKTAMPNDMATLWSDRNCPTCEVHKSPSLLGYKQHLMKCKGYPAGSADIGAHALMHRHNMAKAFA